MTEGWAIVTPKGEIIIYTIASCKEKSIELFDFVRLITHLTCYDMVVKHGYTCKKVTIQIKES